MVKTLVIAIAQRDSVGLTLENEWVAQRKERGVEAYPSEAVLENEVALDKQRVVNAVKRNAVQTVLVSRLLRKDKVQKQIPTSMAARASLEDTMAPGTTIPRRAGP